MPTHFLRRALENATTVVLTTRDRSHRGCILDLDHKGVTFNCDPKNPAIEPPIYFTWSHIDWIAAAKEQEDQ